MDVKVDENSSRSEKLLGKMTGDYSGETEEPQSRVEALLEKLSNSAGEGKIDHALFATKADLADYAKKTDIPTVPEVPTKVSAFENDAGYLTKYQPLDEYAKKTDLSGYALKTDIPSVPTKVSSFENDAGYLTEHQDLSDYAKKTDLTSAEETTKAVEETKKQEEELSANFPNFYLVESESDMTDKSAVYLTKNSDTDYNIYIWNTDYSDYSNPVNKFVAYGNCNQDLSKVPKWQATIVALWCLLNPIRQED